MKISPQEAADRVGVSRRTILDWLRKGKIPYVKLTPKVIRIDSEDIDRLMSGENTGIDRTTNVC